MRHACVLAVSPTNPHHTTTTPTPTQRRPYRRMPLIKLGEHFTHIQDYLERVPNGIPDILCLEHLTVAGDVVFGANVTLKVIFLFCFVWGGGGGGG
jgi:UDP-N-acetylglucosamine pyrophosphorylase